MGKYTDIARSLPPDAADSLPPVQERREAEAATAHPPGCYPPADTPEADAVTRQRWGRMPRGRVAPDPAPIPLPDGLAGLLERHMKAQPAEVHHWIEDQAARYARRFPRLTFPACLDEARLDLLLFQWEAVLVAAGQATRAERTREAAGKLRALETLLEDWREVQP